MRVSRVQKFKKSRRKKVKKLIFFVIIIPLTCITAGYLITTVVILPTMAK